VRQKRPRRAVPPQSSLDRPAEQEEGSQSRQHRRARQAGRRQSPAHPQDAAVQRVGAAAGAGEAAAAARPPRNLRLVRRRVAAAVVQVVAAAVPAAGVPNRVLAAAAPAQADGVPRREARGGGAHGAAARRQDDAVAVHVRVRLHQARRDPHGPLERAVRLGRGRAGESRGRVGRGGGGAAAAAAGEEGVVEGLVFVEEGVEVGWEMVRDWMDGWRFAGRDCGAVVEYQIPYETFTAGLCMGLERSHIF